MAAKKNSKRRLVVIRSCAAGVHIGEEVSKRDSGGRMVVVLANARRLWRWRGANSLSEVALHGVAQDYTRLAEPLPMHEVADVVEVIEVSKAARASLTASRWAQ